MKALLTLILWKSIRIFFQVIWLIYNGIEIKNPCFISFNTLHINLYDNT